MKCYIVSHYMTHANNLLQEVPGLLTPITQSTLKSTCALTSCNNQSLSKLKDVHDTIKQYPRKNLTTVVFTRFRSKSQNRFTAL